MRCVFCAFSLHGTSHSRMHLRSTQRQLAPSAFINYVSCDVYDADLTVTVQLVSAISSRVRYQSHRLWQLTVRRCAENLDRPTAAGYERCRATKIRPSPDVISTPRSTLAERPTAHHVQAVSAGVQVFTWLCCRAMCTGRRRHGAPQSALCHSRSTKFSSVQHEKL